MLGGVSLLIPRFEQKIQTTLARNWGEEKKAQMR
jgi:hypothetical protein